MWEAERDEMGRVQQLKGEIDRVNIEIQVGGVGWGGGLRWGGLGSRNHRQLVAPNRCAFQARAAGQGCGGRGAHSLGSAGQVALLSPPPARLGSTMLTNVAP